LILYRFQLNYSNIFAYTFTLKVVFNILDKIKDSPDIYRQLSIDDQLLAEFNCPLKTPKEEIWTNQSYFVYVIEGKKIWHVPGNAFELTQGKCIFVKKGAHIIEQFFDARFCVVIFFVSDRFISDTIRNNPVGKINQPESQDHSSIAYIDSDDSLHAFFNSVVPYFLNNKEANKVLLELKFKELILNVIGNPKNHLISEYFYSLLNNSFSDCIREILEQNFLFNLRLEDYAKMCGRSLSAFKRDFEEHFNTSPGRWLLNRRLEHAQILISTSDKTISEIAFESGFESASHFSRAFKDRFGSSPANFRQTAS